MWFRQTSTSNVKTGSVVCLHERTRLAGCARRAERAERGSARGRDSRGRDPERAGARAGRGSAASFSTSTMITRFSKAFLFTVFALVCPLTRDFSSQALTSVLSWTVPAGVACAASPAVPDIRRHMDRRLLRRRRVHTPCTGARSSGKCDHAEAG